MSYTVPAGKNTTVRMNEIHPYRSRCASSVTLVQSNTCRRSARGNECFVYRTLLRWRDHLLVETARVPTIPMLFFCLQNFKRSRSAISAFIRDMRDRRRIDLNC